MSDLVKLVGPHGVTAFATAEKADRLVRLQGYKRADEAAPEAVSDPVKPKRGRPKKV